MSAEERICSLLLNPLVMLLLDHPNLSSPSWLMHYKLNKSKAGRGNIPLGQLVTVKKIQTSFQKHKTLKKLQKEKIKMSLVKKSRTYISRNEAAFFNCIGLTHKDYLPSVILPWL